MKYANDAINATYKLKYATCYISKRTNTVMTMHKT
jgi:hypothetical protein